MEIKEQTEKKAYIAPQLTVYGAVEQLTAGGPSGQSEGKSSSPNKKS